MEAFTGPKRFLSERRPSPTGFIEAAQNYVEKLDMDDWLYAKPFDPLPGNRAYFWELYQVVNLIKAMNIRPGGRVLDVGCGPGWVTEILVGLGFNVTGIDPSQGMIDIADDRLARFIEKHRIRHPPQVRFLCTTVEECPFPDSSFDAVLCHEALHHVVDEARAVAQCARVLIRNGVLGVSEAAWIPGHAELEATLEEEMKRFGTIENPFTTEYLDFLLGSHGFRQIERYHVVNGFFPACMADRRIGEIADAPAPQNNYVTALKDPDPTTRDLDAETAAHITLRSASVARDNAGVTVDVTLQNTGKTRWLAIADRFGYVTLALRQGAGGTEAGDRVRLPRDVAPGETVELTATFRLPPGAPASGWELDLVNEQLFWFSQRSTRAAPVTYQGR